MNRRGALHVGLFVLTVISTLFAGSYYITGYDVLADFPNHVAHGLMLGVPFSLPLLTILGSHEFAHYHFARRHGVDATLPYFIPFPNLFGTLGAVIKIRSRIYDRQALIDIGASGPLTGFVLAVFFCVLGLSMSSVIPKRGPLPGEPEFGVSIIYWLLVKLVLHPDETRQIVDLHPVAVAGWVGMFVTSINLIPVGQLDGGHIAFAFLGKWHRAVSLFLIALLALMGFVFKGWIIWAVILIFIGAKHPPVADTYTPVGWKRQLIGVASLVVFIVTFTPVPLMINLGD